MNFMCVPFGTSTTIDRSVIVWTVLWMKLCRISYINWKMMPTTPSPQCRLRVHIYSFMFYFIFCIFTLVHMCPTIFFLQINMCAYKYIIKNNRVRNPTPAEEICWFLMHSQWSLNLIEKGFFSTTTFTIIQYKISAYEASGMCRVYYKINLELLFCCS